MQINRDDMIDAGDVEQVGDHPRRNGAPVGLLLRLPRIREIRHDSYASQIVHADNADAPVIDLAEPPLHAEHMISSSMTLSLILCTVSQERNGRRRRTYCSHSAR
jgi:hypothetical protein